ncbi:hypothetical protein SteCoe_30665 [Stentor coeruleus]|uniref:Uncharacterized protein n=1 Tax=Stentor coeruleus TaxID=5963 RepID=A0A1R2B338_9CILI|nr:hypothetical protein SteCoe_30665 [Stentor coeruleus]
MFPDICVCKEREGKDISKRQVKSTISDNKVRILDYTGALSSSRTLSDAIHPLSKYILYEISSINDSEQEHSIIKIKCFSSDQYLGIYIKLIFSSIGKFLVYIFPIWEEDDKGILEYNFKKKPSKIDKSGKNLGNFIGWLEENKQNPEKLLKTGDNMGKIVYSKLKSLMDESADN